MKKIITLLVAVAFASISGFAAAQASPARSLEPTAQATPATAKTAGKTKAKKSKAPRSKKAKAR